MPRIRRSEEQPLQKTGRPSRAVEGTVRAQPGEMTSVLEDLDHQMRAAAARTDFEEARRLRDQINLIRGGIDPDIAAKADTSQLDRQRAGAMGIGTSRSVPSRPDGWKPPKKPDPMTRGRGR